MFGFFIFSSKISFQTINFQSITQCSLSFLVNALVSIQVIAGIF